MRNNNTPAGRPIPVRRLAPADHVVRDTHWHAAAHQVARLHLHGERKEVPACRALSSPLAAPPRRRSCGCACAGTPATPSALHPQMGCAHQNPVTQHHGGAVLPIGPGHGQQVVARAQLGPSHHQQQPSRWLAANPSAASALTMTKNTGRWPMKAPASPPGIQSGSGAMRGLGQCARGLGSKTEVF